MDYSDDDLIDPVTGLTKKQIGEVKEVIANAEIAQDVLSVAPHLAQFVSGLMQNPLYVRQQQCHSGQDIQIRLYHLNPFASKVLVNGYELIHYLANMLLKLFPLHDPLAQPVPLHWEYRWGKVSFYLTREILIHFYIFAGLFIRYDYLPFANGKATHIGAGTLVAITALRIDYEKGQLVPDIKLSETLNFYLEYLGSFRAEYNSKSAWSVLRMATFPPFAKEEFIMRYENVTDVEVRATSAVMVLYLDVSKRPPTFCNLKFCSSVHFYSVVNGPTLENIDNPKAARLNFVFHSTIKPFKLKGEIDQVRLYHRGAKWYSESMTQFSDSDMKQFQVFYDWYLERSAKEGMLHGGLPILRCGNRVFKKHPPAILQPVESYVKCGKECMDCLGVSYKFTCRCGLKTHVCPLNCDFVRTTGKKQCEHFYFPV